MVKHSTLKLNPFSQETKVLDLLDLLLITLVLKGQRGYVIDVPDIARLLNVFVAVDLSLLVGPIR